MVFLQAAINPHRQYATFKAVEDKRLTLCTSPELIAEVRDVLTRLSLVTKFSTLTLERVSGFLDKVNLLATSFANLSNTFTLPQHPNDDHLFNLAIHAKAQYLVTWETRILNLATETTAEAVLLRKLAPGLWIVTPKQLADILKVT
jgi:putative PIN family toxin of toxin-antitoxin system